MLLQLNCFCKSIINIRHLSQSQSINMAHISNSTIDDICQFNKKYLLFLVLFLTGLYSIVTVSQQTVNIINNRTVNKNEQFYPYLSVAAYLLVIAGSPKNIHMWTTNTRRIWKMNLKNTCLRRYNARSMIIRMNCTSSIPRNGAGTYHIQHTVTITNDTNTTHHCK